MVNSSTPLQQQSEDLLDALRLASDSIRRLDRELRQLDRQFNTQFGVRLGDTLEQLVWEVQRDLERATLSGNETSSRLVQLQDLVHRSALVSTSLELDTVLQRVLDTVIGLVEAERALLLLRPRGSQAMEIFAARNWDHQSLAENEVRFSHSIVEEALSKGEPVVTTNAMDDSRFDTASSVIAQGLRGIVCIPLTMQGRAMGVLYTDSHVSARTLGNRDLSLLATFGTQAAIAIEKARLHEEEILAHQMVEELALGQRIQLSLLPKAIPVRAGWQFSAAYQAARQVGGDFYDWFALPGHPDTQCIVIADVSDKGVPAALFMAFCRAMIRTATTTLRSPATVLKQANTLIQQESSADMFVTAFYAMIDISTGSLVYANAGHNRPLWWHNGEIRELTAKGMLLGMLDDIVCEEANIQLAPGDAILFYTDGLTDAASETGDMFGVERLRDLLRDNHTHTARDIQVAITTAVRDFVGDAPQSDDLTLVVVRRT
jgi:sigma-B regulation protein RsbU (phosphoserine phosphatase)